MATREINSSVRPVRVLNFQFWRRKLFPTKCQCCFSSCPFVLSSLTVCVCLCQRDLKKKKKNEIKDQISPCLCTRARKRERASGCADRSWSALQSPFCGQFCGYRRKGEFISVLRSLCVRLYVCWLPIGAQRHMAVQLQRADSAI